VVAAVLWFYWFWVERRSRLLSSVSGLWWTYVIMIVFSLLHVFIVDFYTYQIYQKM
jgi:hypothetical protein